MIGTRYASSESDEHVADSRLDRRSPARSMLSRARLKAGSEDMKGLMLVLQPFLSSNGFSLEGAEEFLADLGHIVTMGIGEFDG
jgi:hypothetical protein